MVTYDNCKGAQHVLTLPAAATKADFNLVTKLITAPTFGMASVVNWDIS